MNALGFYFLQNIYVFNIQPQNLNMALLFSFSACKLKTDGVLVWCKVVSE